MAVKTKGKTEETKRPTLRPEGMHAEQPRNSQVTAAPMDLVGGSADFKGEGE